MKLRHFVLTRAVYSPDLWTEAANQRRLHIFKAVTVSSLRAQVSRDWSWVVMLHPSDPFYAERKRLILSASPKAIILNFNNAKIPAAKIPATRDVLALRAYTGWRDALRSSEGNLLTTRIDDDDAFTSRALLRIRKAAETRRDQRTAWIIPNGYRLWRGRYAAIRHETNAWASICTPAKDPFVIYDVRHRNIARAAPVRFVDELPGWLWIRHEDTLSNEKAAGTPVDQKLRDLYAVKWSALPPPARTVASNGQTRY